METQLEAQSHCLVESCWSLERKDKPQQLSRIIVKQSASVHNLPMFIASRVSNAEQVMSEPPMLSTAIRRPDFAIAHGNLGSCLLISGVQRAICALRRAVQLEPSFRMSQ